MVKITFTPAALEDMKDIKSYITEETRTTVQPQLGIFLLALAFILYAQEKKNM